MSYFFSLTPKRAKEITGGTFTVEELNDRRIVMLIKMNESYKITIETQDRLVNLLNKELENYRSKTNIKDHSKTVSRRPNFQSSSAFLRIVS